MSGDKVKTNRLNKALTWDQFSFDAILPQISADETTESNNSTWGDSTKSWGGNVDDFQDRSPSHKRNATHAGGVNHQSFDMTSFSSSFMENEPTSQFQLDAISEVGITNNRQHRRSHTSSVSFSSGLETGNVRERSNTAFQPNDNDFGWTGNYQPPNRNTPNVPSMTRAKSEHHPGDIDIDALREQVDSWKSFFSAEEKPPSEKGTDYWQEEQASTKTPPYPQQSMVYDEHGYAYQMPMMNYSEMSPHDAMMQQQWMQHYMYNQQQQQQQQYYQQEKIQSPYMGQSPNSSRSKDRAMKTNSNIGGSKSLCPALVEYRTSGRRPTMQELTGHVVEFSKDAHGSRFVQFKMETATPDEKQVLVDEVLEGCVGLMQDTFGNYVIQNFMEHATSDQRIAIGSTMYGSMVQLSSQAHGCRVVQRAIILLPTGMRNKLLAELLIDPHDASKCSRNSHATHVMQKVVSLIVEEEGSRNKQKRPVETFPDSPSTADLLQAIEEAVALDFVAMSVHPHAYRLVLTVMDDCKSERSGSLSHILDSLRMNQDKLAKDQHGNFILQHILNKGNTLQQDMVQAFVAGHVIELSQHKFGSHLVEKCLSCATQMQVDSLVNELINPSGLNLEQSRVMLNNINSSSPGDKKKGGRGKPLTVEGESTLLLLMQDPYANFVVQRAFDSSQGVTRQSLAQEIKSHSDLLQRFTYGRHILIHINRVSDGKPSKQKHNSAGKPRRSTHEEI